MAETKDAATLLAEAEAERAELDIFIAHMRRKLGLANGEPTAAAATPANGSLGRDAPIVTGRVRPDEFFRLSISDAIMKYLAIMKQPQNPMAIVNGIRAGGILTNAKNFYANVNTELKRMRERDLIVNTPSGWGLAEWYPGRPKQAETKPKKKGAKGARAKQPKALKDGSMAGPVKKAATEETKYRGPYQQFLAEQLAKGTGMKEAAAAWREKKKQAE